MKRLRILSVLGAGKPTPEEIEVAEKVGALTAAKGWVLLTGGGPGIMEAASKGAAEAGGLTVGILPADSPSELYPNRWVKIPIYTGIGAARNVINVLSGDLIAAVGGQTGTLSEVAHALKAGREVLWFRPWTVEPPQGHEPPQRLRRFQDAEAFLSELERRMR